MSICISRPTQQTHRRPVWSNGLFSLPKSHLGNVLVDMKLIDIKDTLPVGFIPIQETVDTRESPVVPPIPMPVPSSGYSFRWCDVHFSLEIF